MPFPVVADNLNSTKTNPKPPDNPGEAMSDDKYHPDTPTEPPKAAKSMYMGGPECELGHNG